MAHQAESIVASSKELLLVESRVMLVICFRAPQG